MNFLSRRGVIGEIKYDLETKEWIKLSSTFLNEKNVSAIIKITSWNKKTKI